MGLAGEAFQVRQLIRIAKSQSSGTRFDKQRVSVSVVAAFEFDDLVSPRIAMSQSNGRHSLSLSLSVPLFTIRTFSIEGTISIISSAMVIS